MKFRSSFVCVNLLILFAWMSPTACADEWTPLFDGKTLDGWKQEGGKATYVVKNGEIVGTAVPNTPNSFLCTKKTYGDFVLELEFKVDPVLNSGVQIRSHVYKEDQVVTIKGKKRKKTAGTVYGYQVEIDPSERAFTGGIYDEARRGWLFPGKFTLKRGKEAGKEFTTRGQESFKWDDWNTIVIKCRGNHIQTWLNGIARADFRDTDKEYFTPEGFIGLQVHGGKSAHVKWRRLYLKEL